MAENNNGNRIEYTGRITETPVYRETANSAVLNLKIAENHRVKNRQTNEWEDAPQATWHEVSVWNSRDDSFADDLAANPDINRGALVRISARYQTEAYETKQGEKRTAMREVANSVKVLFAPKEAQPAVKPFSDDWSAGTDDGGAF